MGNLGRGDGHPPETVAAQLAREGDELAFRGTIELRIGPGRLAPFVAGLIVGAALALGALGIATGRLV